MSGKVTLEIVEGEMIGKTFAFEEHDTFLFGRSKDCHACLPNDPLVSRHHFIVEVNPPDARVRDLGSLNGTHVNGVQHGGREKGETPEEGAKRRYPDIELKDGDKLQVGNTLLAVRIEVPMFCCECGKEITGKAREDCRGPSDTYLCPACKRQLGAARPVRKTPEPTRCKKCGKDVAGEIGQGRRGDYVCETCRKEAEADPAKILFEMLRRAGQLQGGDKAPEIKGYEIDRRLGIGGCGAVYLARRKKDNERVAIKVMLSKIAVDENARKKFLHEIELMKDLRHGNIVTLFDNGSASSAFYFVMEFCEGGGVEDLMKRRGGKLSISEAGAIMLQALDGLAYAHGNNVVHRDLKPGNILLKGSETRWTAKIADLGFAKNFQQAGFSGMTMTGQYAGTPAFMPREQVTNFKYVKPVSDVWSIGATFYTMLTGQLPRDFPRGKNPMEIILRGEIVPIRKRDAGVPRKLAEVIDRALANDPKERYQDAAEMRRALEGAL